MSSTGVQDANELHLETGRLVVNCLDVYQNDRSNSLLAAGCDDRVIIWTFQVNDFSGDSVALRLTDLVLFSNILEVKVGIEVERIAWVPKTVYLKHFVGEAYEEEGILSLMFAGSDHHLYKIESDLKTTEVSPIGKHKGSVMDIAVRPLTGEESQDGVIIAASASCDCRCVIWSVQAAEVLLVLKLKSWGVGVSWYPLDPLQLMVAESGGVVRFYRIDTGQPVRSLLAPSRSLRSAALCPVNPDLVGAVCGTECCLWDVSVGFPLDSRPAHSSGGLAFKWSSSSDALFSTIGLDNEVKVHHKGHKVAMVKRLPVAKAMTWATENGVHMLIVCSNGRLCVWHVKD